MTLEKFLRYVVLAGVFILPFIVLYVARSLFFPFITGKNFAFRIIVELIAGAWVALALVNPAYRPKRSWLLYAFAAFVALIAISDLFGVYPHKSFWSNYERMEGWVTLAHLFVYFVVVQSVLTTQALWKKWWHTSLWVSGLVSCYALFQFSGFITINQGGIRLDATFGNATYLGVYMMFHIFIAALYLAQTWVEKGPGKRTTQTALYGALIAVNSFVLFFTSTRGAILGLIGGGALSALILIALAPRSRVAWRAGAVMVGFVVLSGAFWLVSDKEWVHKIEPLHRIANISSEGLPDARVMNWGMATKGFKERPILGWGQENFSAVFDKHYDPYMYAQEPWFDRVHNVIFDWLIAGGILGLLAYLSLHALALFMIWRSGAFLPYERAILTGLLAGYFFYLLFTFDNITSYLFFVSLLAYLTFRAHENTVRPVTTNVVSQKLLPGIATSAIIASFALVWLVNAEAITQNKTIIQGISPHAGGAQVNLDMFSKAVAYNSVGNQEAREQFSQAAIASIGAQGIPNELKMQFVQRAYDAMQEQSADAPYSARFPFFSGILLDHAGLYADARTSLEKAHSLSPGKQAILFELGLNAFARGQNEEAVGYFKKAYELAPEFRDAGLYYIAALVRAGKDAEADAMLKPLIDADTATDARISSAYASRNRFDKIAEIWSAHIEKKPDDIEARFVLAGAYYSAGASEQAIRELESVKVVSPGSAAQADALIQQVKSGVKIQ